MLLQRPRRARPQPLVDPPKAAGAALDVRLEAGLIDVGRQQVGRELQPAGLGVGERRVGAVGALVELVAGQAVRVGAVRGLIHPVARRVHPQLALVALHHRRRVLVVVVVAHAAHAAVAPLKPRGRACGAPDAVGAPRARGARATRLAAAAVAADP
eukprot:2429447-Prymnesium_polylepis.1